jgi:predicted DCC family thiol-disulfide oxidoreductase YuxK
MPFPQTQQPTKEKTRQGSPLPQVTLLYDGECPFCLREVRFLRGRDRAQGRVQFIDIADLDYNPSSYQGITYEAAMGRIHAILADGTVLQNIAAFQRVYEILEMGWVYGLTKVPVIGAIADQVYGLWADWRLMLTGRPSIEVLVAERQTCMAKAAQQQEAYSLD